MDAGRDDLDGSVLPAEPRRTADLEALRDRVLQVADVECTGHLKAFVGATIDATTARIDVQWKGNPPASIIKVLEAAPTWARVRVRRLEWTRRELDAASEILFGDSRPAELEAQIDEIVPTFSSLQFGGAGLLLDYTAESDDPAENARISAALTAIAGVPVWARWTEDDGDSLMREFE